MVLLAFSNTAVVTIQLQIIFFLTDKLDSSLAVLTASPPLQGAEVFQSP